MVEIENHIQGNAAKVVLGLAIVGGFTVVDYIDRKLAKGSRIIHLDFWSNKDKK